MPDGTLKPSKLLTGSGRPPARLVAVAGYGAVAWLVFAFTEFFLSRQPLDVLVVSLAVLTSAIVFVVISFRILLVPFFLWFLALSGFRYVFGVQTALLPDLFVDRILLIWLGAVFFAKFFYERQKPIGPYMLDYLVLVHALYILVRIFFDDMIYFHGWTVTIAGPYAAYFFAKNLVNSRRAIDIYMFVLFGLCIYWEITSIAQKFDLDWLLWPRYMATDAGVFVGRSSGPFRQAPLFGTVIGMVLPVHFWVFFKLRRPMLRVLVIGSLLMAFAGLYFTYTRGSWLAGIAALTAVVLLNRGQYLRLAAPALVGAALAAMFVLGIGQDQFMKERVQNENTLENRIGTAVTALRVWQDHPLFGVGYFRYQSRRDEYIRPVEVPVMGTIRVSYFRNIAIHDIYFGPLAEDGVVGAIIQGSIWLIILHTLIRKYRWRTRGDPVATYAIPVFVGMLAGYLVGGIAIDYRYFAVVNTLLFTMAGIIYGYREVGAEDGALTRPHDAGLSAYADPAPRDWN